MNAHEYYGGANVSGTKMTFRICCRPALAQCMRAATFTHQLCKLNSQRLVV
jgi:hypothetical protein